MSEPEARGPQEDELKSVRKGHGAGPRLRAARDRRDGARLAHGPAQAQAFR